jgi:glycosyltransferase involved in cell wall biosynthesis
MSRESAARPPVDAVTLQADILRGARFILPNSEAEKQHLIERFGSTFQDRIRVVMNGVSPLPPRADAGQPRDIFLCAGAIGPRKNQLGLVKAFRQLPEEQLLLLGATASGCRRYRRAVERAAGQNVEFHEPIPHDRMGAFLQRAKAYVQPSYIETPGLGAMEAAAAGIPIVVSDVAPVREYFGTFAHYCDPARPDSIARACLAAAKSTCDGEPLARRFDWDTVLTPLESVYSELAANLGKPDR